MAWVTMGALAALGDVAAAGLVQRPTQTRAAVDARVQVGTASAVSAAIADNQTVTDAAVRAVDAAVGPALDLNYPSLKPPHADNLGNTTNLDTVIVPKRYKRITSAPAGMNYPAGAMHGILDVVMVSEGSNPYVLQIWTDAWNGWQANRRLYVGAWTAWRRLEPLGTLPERVTALEASDPVSGDELGVRRGEHDMRLNGLRQRIGKVSHPGKAVVAFVADHGSQQFQDIVLPKLRQHGMPSTLAMCATQLTLAPTVEVDSWAPVIGWAANDGVEIACHSETHQDVTGVAALKTEIIESRDNLSANLGGLPVDTWVQPGARNVINPGASYDGFMDGQGAERYWSTPAGEMIWNGYAFATGQVSNQSTRVYPCTGEPPLGPARRFIDSGAADIERANAEIDAAVASGGRYIVSVHPQSIRSDGRTDMITQAQIEAFIDSLAAREADGEIALVQLREWALAEA